ncbi:hypothetical protein CA85_11540 [Allorhodopirellula solitaria]|uniref:Uncharacterized protein n=1 Tax=Allorhodopirellula solitaria TaxID=2527987 RepID=A0A5C5YET9_9BACT|nr:hypothetical protein CA85_11540 [Allorhodopirellula solitaria]
MTYKIAAAMALPRWKTCLESFFSYSFAKQSLTRTNATSDGFAAVGIPESTDGSARREKADTWKHWGEELRRAEPSGYGRSPFPQPLQFPSARSFAANTLCS